MDGIEKITARIREDAQREIAGIEAQAAQKAEAIREQYREQAKREAQTILTRGQKAAEERQERLQSAAGLERRKLELAAKQEVLNEAFALAVEKLCSLPEEQYIALLADMAVRAARSGREQLIFSQKDRARIGKQVVMAANEILVKRVAPELPESLADSKVGAFLGKVVQSTTAMVTGTGMLTLSEETRPIRGGFILSDGDVEVNCAFDVLVRMERERLEKDVADLLFAQ
jgi:V/A-type H+-transporting ATPase subunit E